jgi:hypothetical protein
MNTSMPTMPMMGMPMMMATMTCEMMDDGMMCKDDAGRWHGHGDVQEQR